MKKFLTLIMILGIGLSASANVFDKIDKAILDADTATTKTLNKAIEKKSWWENFCAKKQAQAEARQAAREKVLKEKQAEQEKKQADLQKRIETKKRAWYELWSWGN